MESLMCRFEDFVDDDDDDDDEIWMEIVCG